MLKKGSFWIKKSSSTILLFSLGFHLSSLLFKWVEDVACESSHNDFYKKNERLNLYMFNLEPTSQRRLYTLYCIMESHGQYRANGLIFTPV